MSEHFSVDEFRCHDGAEYPAEWVDDRLAVLCRVLEAIRTAWGGPLTVVSGYRTAAYNARIGGAKLSQHVQGRAADVRPTNPTPERVAQLHRLVKQMQAQGRLDALGGLGEYVGWIHVDIRSQNPVGHLATWTGNGVGSEA